MSLDAASAIAVAAAVALAVVIVVIVVACGGRTPGRRPGGGGGAAAVHDVERALGDAATLVTYEQARAAAGKKSGGGSAADEEEAPRCALCLSEFASSDSKAGGELELVRVVSACGHFFHAECGVDGWLRARGTCPLCRAEVWTTTLPRPPRPECPPRSGGDTVRSR
ncbi:hypothetical protein BDA96_01G161800 [Sorghum bicolor]|jgi:hypothetical protein|uniref:RING-type E3 ubiquitin transferase n=2 Tax=Sorghum bicolor TaxID=4558 RepID=C5WR52_SORBI|nr:E3 ubiquitin-protein ligase EL5 [Sorghum bicolor]EER93744.1 hypothetical protein SORBI_3001G153900 [Sorghum bicolor]KAG0548377.1 hypothetical protein BDA96_01G161800 [Sorghum bicolor]|eukprot:XP_002466746.1 E3 ubiquitin-protein ligase EL5 [Sorghum bicolor]